MANDISQLVANPEMLGLERQRQMAQMLLKQGMQMPQGQMIGDRYVPTNPMQYIGNLFNVYAGQKGLESTDQQELALAKALREKKLIETNDIMQSLTGAPEKTTELAGPSYQGVAPSAVMPAVPASPQEALAKALKSETGAGNMLLPSIIEQVLPKQIPDQIKFKMAKEGGYTGTFNDFINQMTEADKARIAIDKQRLGLEGARLGLEQQKLSQEMQMPKLTESQGNAVGFGVRAKEANSLLNQLEQSGVKDTGKVRSTVAGIVGATPFVGEKAEQGMHAAMNVLPEFLGGPSEAQQATDQARRNFVTAVLRKESGAAISNSEFYNEAQKYFPQPGDAPSVIKQKQHARETAIKSLEYQAGQGAKYIESSPTPKLDIGDKKPTLRWNPQTNSFE
jgi:hypothetical protein